MGFILKQYITTEMQSFATGTAAKQTLKCSWKLSAVPLVGLVECNDCDKWLTLLSLTDIKLKCTAGSLGFCNTSVDLDEARFQMENLNSVREPTWKPCVPEARLSCVSTFSGDSCFMLSLSGDFSLKVNLILGFRQPFQRCNPWSRRLNLDLILCQPIAHCWRVLNTICWRQPRIKKSLH